MYLQMIHRLLAWLRWICRWTAAPQPVEPPPVTPPPVEPPVEPPPVEPPVVPLPEPPARPALQALQTRPGSRWLHTADGVPCDYRESTVGGIYRLWLDGRVDEIDALLDWLTARGITAIRPWLCLDSEFWRSHERTTTFVGAGDRWFEELVPFVRHVAERHGCYSRICLIAGVEPFGAVQDWERRPDVVTGRVDVIRRMHAYVDRVVTEIRDEPCLIEIANEPAQIGFGPDSGVVLELGQHAHDLAPARLMNFGAATDESSTFYAQAPADWLDEHLQRVDDWDAFGAVKRIWEHPAIDVEGMPVISGEWMNLGTDGQESTALAFGAAALLRIKRVIPAFHAHALLWPDVPDTATAASLEAWSRGCDLVPMDWPGVGCNGHWSCSPVAPEAFPESEDATDAHDGPIRVYGRVGERGYLGISLREPAGYSLPAREGRTFETVHVERWGGWQARMIRA